MDTKPSVTRAQVLKKHKYIQILKQHNLKSTNKVSK